jgi:hypothetical protein
VQVAPWRQEPIPPRPAFPGRHINMLHVRNRCQHQSTKHARQLSAGGQTVRPLFDIEGGYPTHITSLFNTGEAASPEFL